LGSGLLFSPPFVKIDQPLRVGARGNEITNVINLKLELGHFTSL